MIPRLLMISHVLPAHPASGQQRRVNMMLRMAREYFHTTLLTYSASIGSYQTEVEDLCDSLLVLPSRNFSVLDKLYNLPGYLLYKYRHGLKRSNYVIGEIEFSPDRVRNILRSQHFDFVIFEYWHAYRSTKIFDSIQTVRILDMHDVLWKAYEVSMKTSSLPNFIKCRMVNRYRCQEEAAWNHFDRIITINSQERQLVRSSVSSNIVIDYLPMGVDLREWQFISKIYDMQPKRIGFYGGLGSSVNVRSALVCLDEIMPSIWAIDPTVEFWLVGNKPADVLIQRAKADSRIRVTGFVEDVGSVLSKLTAVLCPWVGTYGFRSRVIELMALGIPIIASPDAIAGMDIHPDAILLGDTSKEVVELFFKLDGNPELVNSIRTFARKEVEARYSLEATYKEYFKELQENFFQQNIQD